VIDYGQRLWRYRWALSSYLQSWLSSVGRSSVDGHGGPNRELQDSCGELGAIHAQDCGYEFLKSLLLLETGVKEGGRE
jgi:hypothetical protein